MLFDAFISHASEDKDSLVRALATALQANRVEVWYDEFSLRAGDSLRRSIDIGLSKSRYGIVILSKAFFAKKWPQWELDGLVQRQNSEGGKLLLPVWHGVTREEVMEYSPSLADKVAVNSEKGIEHVTQELLKVIQPEGSTLLIARDILIEAGYKPPVVTDDWWLDVVAAAAGNSVEGTFQDAMGWGRWGFPLPPESSSPSERGLRLGQAAMQMLWQQAAHRQKISQLTEPKEVFRFIDTNVGLARTCEEFLPFLAAYAPQVTIPGCGGEFEDLFEDWYQNSLKGHIEERKQGNRVRKIQELLALRDPTFGDYEPATIACNFVQGDIMGPEVKVYENIDYIAWFLSDQSAWMPLNVREFLMQGLKEWAVWLWHSPTVDSQSFGVEDNPIFGSLSEDMHKAKTVKKFRLSEKGRQDIETRLQASANLLDLPESGTELAPRFIDAHFIESWYADRKEQHQKMRANKRRAAK